MGVVNVNAHDDANVLFQTKFLEVLQDAPEGVMEQFTETVPSDQKYVEIDTIASIPRVRQWTGSKQRKELRAYAARYKVVKFESTIGVDRFDLDYDNTGAVEATIRRFLAANRDWMGDLLTARALANTWTSYDGVSLLNDSHPFTSGTGDNLTTDAFSDASLKAGREAMFGFADEDGTPIGQFPTAVMVSKENERLARELTGSDRLVSMNNAGAQDATSNVVAAQTLPVYVGGDMAVIVNRWFNATAWMLLNGGAPGGAKPFMWWENRAMEAVPLDEFTGETRFFEDRYLYSIEADGVFTPGAWQLAYGNVGS